MAETIDVAVVGAGPFGLSVAAHLQDRATRVFGTEMATWRHHMPPDMLLRSAWEETSLAAPDDLGTIQAWADATGRGRQEPIPLQLFLAYSAWFAKRFVAQRDPSDIVAIEAIGSGFRLSTAAGAVLEARLVVLAVGVMPFAHVPSAFADLLGDDVALANGTTEDADELTGRRLLVIGGGQAGLETAALAARAGADVELVTRSGIRWFTDHEPQNPRGAVGRRLYQIAYPAVGYGPPPLNRLVLHPDLFATLPHALKTRLTRRLLRPGGSPWLRPLVEEKVKLTENASVVRLERHPRRALIATLADGSRREVDAVRLACGYRFDLDRLTFLAPGLRAGITTRDRWPVLDRSFRTTDPRVFAVGYAAEGRFGPISRFVLGTHFTATRVAAALRI